MHPNLENQKCCFHPQHIIIGVCALCLNERLLILASNQEIVQQSRRSFNLIKFLSFTSLLSNFNNKNNKKTQTDDDHGSGASTSQEESFISITFEGSGVGSWEKRSTKPKVSIEHHQQHYDNYISLFNQKVIKGDQEGFSAVIEHSKMRGQLRWQKRIGHLFQIIGWKRPIGKVKGHVPTNLEGHVKVRNGWIESLTKRRTKD